MPFQKKLSTTTATNPFASEILRYLDRLSNTRTTAYGLLVTVLQENGVKSTPRTIRAWSGGKSIPSQSELIISILRKAFGEHR